MLRPPIWSKLRKAQLPFTLESRKSLAQFDLIGFTLQYELSYTNILNMMNLAGIPLKEKNGVRRIR